MGEKKKFNQKDVVKLGSNKYRRRLENVKWKDEAGVESNLLQTWDQFVLDNPDKKSQVLYKAWQDRGKDTEATSEILPAPTTVQPSGTVIGSKYFNSEKGITPVVGKSGVMSGTIFKDVSATDTGSFEPGVQTNWDYKTAQVDLKGNAIPKSATTWGAKGFDPNGDIYFGTGLGNALKKWGWQLFGEDSQKEQVKSDWSQLVDFAKQEKITWSIPGSPEALAIQKENSDRAGKMLGKAWSAFLGLSDMAESGKGKEGGKYVTVSSPLTPVLRATKVLVGAGFEVLQRGAVAMEQYQGMLQAEREYADTHSKLPSLAAEDPNMGFTFKEGDPNDPNSTYRTGKEYVNTVSRLLLPFILPFMAGYDHIRFMLSKGTVEEKKFAATNGWNEGRLLFSELVHPAIQAEFQRRVASGEDPALLAMEMQDPWAEAVGQMIVDPLNAIGLEFKSAKFAKLVTEEASLVKTTGLIADPEFIKVINSASDISQDAEAARALDNVVAKTIDSFDGALAVQKYTPTALNASGMRIDVLRKTGGVLGWKLSNLRQAGQMPDKMIDWVVGLVKLSSKNADEVKDAFITLGHMDNMAMNFTQEFMETSKILRSVVESDVPALIKKLKSDSWEEMANTLNKVTQNAADKLYPTVQEMQKASEAVSEAKLTGKAPPQHILDLAAQYEKVSPGVKRLATIDNLLVKPKNWINGKLGMFYFTYNYGFAARNAIQNTVMLLMDAPNTIFMSNKKLETFFASIGGEPASIKNTFGRSVESSETILGGLPSATNLSGMAERWAGKRIYYKYYTDTMDKMLQAGVGLPPMEQWRAAGISNEMVDDLSDMIRGAGYNTKEAKKAFTAKYSSGVDMWRRATEYVSPENIKGLQEAGLWDEVRDMLDVVKNPDIMPDEISKTIDDMRYRARVTANQAVNDMAGMSKTNPNAEHVAEVVEKSGKNLSVADQTEMAVLHESGYQAVQEWTDALGKASAKLGDQIAKTGDKNGKLRQIQEAINKYLGNNTAKLMNNQVADKVQKRWDWVWDLNDKAKKGFKPTMWDTALLGKAPENVTYDLFREAIFAHGKEFAKTEWRGYFSSVFAGGQELAKRTGLDSLFEKAQTAVDEFNNYREVVYDNRGGVYRHAPVLAATEVGTAQHGGEIAKLANGYGIDSSASVIVGGQVVDGAKKDKMLLNVINKGVDVKYTNLNDVPLDVAEKAFARHKGMDVQGFAQTAGGPSSDLFSKMTEGDRRIPAYQKLRNNWRSLSVAEQEEAMLWITGKIAKDPTTGLETIFSKGLETKPAGWHEAYVDANGLGAINQKWGHGAGNVFLKGVGDATNEVAKKFGGRAFRVGGDEISLWFPDASSAKKAMAELDKSFSETVLTFKGKTGKTYNKKGFSVSYGTGKTEELADKALFADKERRIATGQRPPKKSPKGTLPGSIVDAGGGKRTGTGVGKIPQEVKPGVRVPPPLPDGANPMMRMGSETLKGTLDALDELEAGIFKNWGMKGEKLTPEAAKNLGKIMRGVGDRVNETKYIAAKVADKYRDFALLPYGSTTHLDHAASFIMPYQFWYSRTYTNWAKRIVTDGAVLANYGRFKDAMAQQYKELPEYYKYNIDFGKWIGADHPMLFNLEATLWPLTGITGVDFEDPMKRTNTFTALVDDMGKFGPTMWAPINWGIAAYYAAAGQKDVASKWAGRMVPQTASIKAASSLMFGKPIELDPNVQMFSGKGLFDFGAMDQYEEGRVSRALSTMEAEGVPQEQLIEAARTHSGPLWEEAYRRAIDIRARGQIMSSLLGVGFKERTQEDVQLDAFYSDYSRLRGLHDAKLVSDIQYKNGFEKLRQTYPFMDTVLLSRRAGSGRDASYAYNVISRIPPGMSTEIYKAANIDPALASKFYETGGDMTGWSENQKSLFITGMVNIGAVLEIPKNAQRQDYNLAKTKYNLMDDEILKVFGQNTVDGISLFFAEKDWNKAEDFLRMRPDVADALKLKDSYIAQDPTLLRYYGGIKTIERFYTAQMDDKLEEKFGEGITKIAQDYSNMPNVTKEDKAARAEYKKQHPELKKYWDEKYTVLLPEVNKKVVLFGASLPDTSPMSVRTDTTPETGTPQQAISDLAVPLPRKSFQDYQRALPNNLADVIADYYVSGDEIPQKVMTAIENYAKDTGQNPYTLIRDISIAVEQMQ